MSGALAAMAGIGMANRYSVTVGSQNSIFGFNDSGGYGAMSPASYFGATIRNVSSSTSVGSEDDITIVIEGNLTQSHFSRLQVQTTSGSTRVFRAADATFSTFGSSPVLSQWRWDSNTPCWTATGTRSIVLHK